MDALIHLKESRDMVKKRFPPSEYGANYPDLGIASEARHSSHLSVELSSLYVNAHGTNTPRPGLGSGEGETLPTDTSCAAV